MGEYPLGDLNALADNVLVRLILVSLAADDGKAWDFFEVLYNRYVREVTTTVYRFLSNHYGIHDNDLARQVTGDAFLRAWEGLRQKDPEAPFLAWIKIIGTHVAQEQMRSMGRTIPFGSDPLDDPNLLEESPSESLFKTQLQAKFERVRERLPERQRTVFTLHFDQGYKPQKIAQALNIKPASARQSLWRAISRFRAEWAKDQGEPDIPAPILKPKRGGEPGSSKEF